MRRFLFARLGHLRAAIHKVLTREQGASLVEYSLLVALMAVVCLVGITAIGPRLSHFFNYAAGLINTAGS